jgi:hypothetical protein
MVKEDSCNRFQMVVIQALSRYVVFYRMLESVSSF